MPDTEPMADPENGQVPPVPPAEPSPPVADDPAPETEHIEDEGEPLGGNFV